MVERLVEALEVERDADATVTVAPPQPRPGLAASFAAAEVAVRANLPSPERAAELRAVRREREGERETGEGPPPLVHRQPPTVPNRPLSYTAIHAYEECPYRFYLERVLGLPSRNLPSWQSLHAHSAAKPCHARGGRRGRGRGARRGLAFGAGGADGEGGGGARAARVEPGERLARAPGGAGAEPRPRRRPQLGDGEADSLLEPLREWLRSPLRERIEAEAGRVRAEVPILLGLGETVLRGSIDLLVERDGAPPLVVDYKTDRLGGSEPSAHAARYETQRAIYALATAESLGAPAVEVAYVFLERPAEPVLTTLERAEMTAARQHLETTIRRIAGGDFPVAPEARRSWDLCRGCPALGNLCSGPSSDGRDRGVRLDSQID